MLAANINPFQQKGIGRALQENRFRVPLNQRDYAWEAEHVTELLQDIFDAISDQQDVYFLGIIVLAINEEGELEVTDGQQRLATTTILLAAIRDYFREDNDTANANSIETDFLFSYDRNQGTSVPHLTLNVDDGEFFKKRVLSQPGSADRSVKPTRDSHRKIDQAATLARQHVRHIVSGPSHEGKTRLLLRWVNFINHRLQVILLTSSNEFDAFMMFETLNDRGLPVSQADLLKNHLFKRAGKNRLPEAQQKWARMTYTLEANNVPYVTVNYLRHLMTATHGPTTEKNILRTLKKEIRGEQQSISLLDELAEGAEDYAAMLSPGHYKWESYGDPTREHLRIIHDDLQVEQIRPLLFAIVKWFAKEEARKALQACVAWSVRFLLLNKRGGVLNDAYGSTAHKIKNGEIATAKAIWEGFKPILESDGLFEATFAEARVAQPRLGRYYLRALECQEQDETEPEWNPNRDPNSITLEHIIPEHPDRNWPDLAPDEVAANYKRIGNLCLLKRTPNSELKSKPFSEKRIVYADSNYLLTQMVALKDAWGPDQVDERQKALAKLAVKTWPLKPRSVIV